MGKLDPCKALAARTQMSNRPPVPRLQIREICCNLCMDLGYSLVIILKTEPFEDRTSAQNPKNGTSPVFKSELNDIFDRIYNP